MKFLPNDRRAITSVWAKDVEAGDTLCETLYRYCEERCTDPVYREEGRVVATHQDEPGTIWITWRTPYGETRHQEVPAYVGVMVVR